VLRTGDSEPRWRQPPGLLTRGNSSPRAGCAMPTSRPWRHVRTGDLIPSVTGITPS
jgi:hypothetical protein